MWLNFPDKYRWITYHSCHLLFDWCRRIFNEDTTCKHKPFSRMSQSPQELLKPSLTYPMLIVIYRLFRVLQPALRSLQFKEEYRNTRRPPRYNRSAQCRRSSRPTRSARAVPSRRNVSTVHSTPDRTLSDTSIRHLKALLYRWMHQDRYSIEGDPKHNLESRELPVHTMYRR